MTRILGSTAFFILSVLLLSLLLGMIGCDCEEDCPDCRNTLIFPEDDDDDDNDDATDDDDAMDDDDDDDDDNDDEMDDDDNDDNDDNDADAFDQY